MCITCGCSSENHHDNGHDHHHDHDHGHHHHKHGHHDHHYDHNHEQGEHRHGDVEGAKKITVEADILDKNNRLGAGNRALFREKGIFVLNLVSSPGSGKTTILERTLRQLMGTFRCAVIEGDQQTDNDARRIAATGVPVKQINTGAGCHLDAHMICHAIDEFDLDSLDILFIENVGNLVCPASFDLGEDHKVALLSVTEGEDKPLTYPQMFHAADLILMNKVDLLPHLDFDMEACQEMARRVSPGIRIFETSARNGQGMDSWYEWLAEGVKKQRPA